MKFFSSTTLVGALVLSSSVLAEKGKAATSTTKASSTKSAAASVPAASSPAAGGAAATSAAGSGSGSAAAAGGAAAPTGAIAGPVTVIQGTSLPATFGSGTSLAPGATPSGVAGAPALPNVANFVSTNYPPLDVTPDINSPQVKQWISQIDWSKVPQINPSNKGECPAGVQTVASQDTACWWTCSKCTTADDIVSCPQKNTWGLTLDDGPSPAAQVLQPVLDANNLKATLFVVGSRVVSYPQLLQDQYVGGNQIAVHTWSHPPLTSLSNEQIVAEFGWSKQAIHDVLGVTPIYWRAPYGDVDNRVRAIAKQMNLTNIIWTTVGQQDFDTQDWQVGSAPGVTEQTVVTNFQNILKQVPSLPGGFIVLEHNLLPEEANIAMNDILPMALGYSPKLQIQDIMTCMGLSMGAAYAETNTSSLPTTSVSGSTGTNGTASSATNSTGSNSKSGASSQFGVTAGAILGAVGAVAAALL